MARLIDADALRERHCEGCNEDIREMCRVDPICASLQWVDEEPTVDAVKVVRCVNCKSHEPCEVRNRVWCKTMGRYMKEDGFCSEGENNAENH